MLRPLRAFVGTLAAAALTVGLAAMPAQAAPAVDCNLGTPLNNDLNTIDYTIDSSPGRTGPYEACSRVATIPADTPLYVSCYVENSYGNTWSYIGLRGFWIYDAHFLDGGAGKPCVFL